MTDPTQNPEEFDVPVEGDDLELDAPRREASARFDVQSEVGSDAMLREAMDPANQSLAEALRLSFRVLQAVILVLVVLFIFSGFQTVEKGQSGVLLRWGRILESDGMEALEPGLQFSMYPYPVGEFVLFDVADRQVSDGQVFWPRLGPRTLEEATEAAVVTAQLRPEDGNSILTAGGDIGHMRATVSYDIVDPATFVRRIEETAAGADRLDADRLVSLALRRAAVHYAAKNSMEAFVDMGEVGMDEMRQSAQALLNQVDVGIRISDVALPDDPTPALAIRRSFNSFREAEITAGNLVADAETDVDTTRIAVTGKDRWDPIVQSIQAFERAYDSGADAEAERQAVFAAIEDSATSGEVRTIIEGAKSYRTIIKQTLGLEARRFEGVLARFNVNPRVTVQQEWLQAYGAVMAGPGSEIFYVPQTDGPLRISVSGSDSVRQDRRRNRLEAGRRQTYLDAFSNLRKGNILWGSEMKDADKAGRSLRQGGGSIVDRTRGANPG